MTTAQSMALLKQARNRFTQREIAEHVGKTPKTVRRWEKGEIPCPAMLESALRDLLQQPSAAPAEGNRFRFIDLFAGVGGIRMGFEAHGGECIFTSEWNDFSKKTYIENYGDNHQFVGDIVLFPAEEVPDHDVLLAGFPCQPFSIAGVSKKTHSVAHMASNAPPKARFSLTWRALFPPSAPKRSFWKTSRI